MAPIVSCTGATTVAPDPMVKLAVVEALSVNAQEPPEPLNVVEPRAATPIIAPESTFPVVVALKRMPNPLGLKMTEEDAKYDPAIVSVPPSVRVELVLFLFSRWKLPSCVAPALP